MRHRLFSLLPALFVAVLLPSPALASGSDHDGPVEPFKVEVKSNLPESGAKAHVENGVITLEVQPGHVLVAYGMEDEEFLRINADGVALGVKDSVTFQMAEMSELDTAQGTVDTGRVVVGTGGKVTYHEHRAHFMGQSVDPSLTEGAVVSTFSLPFELDGEKALVTGSLLFAPSMNPERADELQKADSIENEVLTATPEMKTTSCVDPMMDHSGMDHSGMNDSDMTEMDHSKMMGDGHATCDDLARHTDKDHNKHLALGAAVVGTLVFVLAFLLVLRRNQAKAKAELASAPAAATPAGDAATTEAAASVQSAGITSAPLAADTSAAAADNTDDVAPSTDEGGESPKEQSGE